MAIHTQDQPRVGAWRVLGGSRVYVAGDKQIEIAVAIDIRKRTTGAPDRRGDTGRFRDVDERAVTVVPVQQVGADVGDVEVDPSVVVNVAGARAHTEPAMPDACDGRP